MNNVYIARTKRTGLGVFANKNFVKGEIIFECKGKVVERPYGHKDAYRIGARWVGIGNRLWLIPPKSNPLYRLNHSCNPNAGFMWKTTIVAMRNIRKGEEVTIDYSVTEADPCWWMRCRCGNKNCRKVIRPIVSLPPKLFKKYREFISPYFRRVYLKSRNERNNHSK